ncbi:MAG: bifunctional diaminohydroxyphosphoribosylaminopyrimidine deaminase/5-amino-6-(5-phosphoribosylamino)uracil reductase RibD [Phycisphaerales bacterium]
MSDQRSAKFYLDMAARAALRGFGDVSPNPMVGAVIVKDGGVIGIGHHCKFGGLHAEREALANARARGHDASGATVYCTLEPCSHVGKQPACTEALIEAGVARVVCARRDPVELSSGGFAVLEAHGIACSFDESSELAHRVAQPWVHGVETGLPWVIAKWAQTIDGKIATRTGESQWISNERSRASVHRLRARVDAVAVGMGTVVADDPMLTARGVRRVRRSAKRVVFDTHGRIPEESKLVRSAGEHETVVCAGEGTDLGFSDVRVLGCPVVDGRIDLRSALMKLRSECGVSTILIEAGPTLLGSLLDAELINEAVVHLAPGVMGDDSAMAAARGRECSSLDQMKRFSLMRIKRVVDDVHLHYWK